MKARYTDSIVVTRLQDIADDLGVSKVTVSKVLRGSPDVGSALRQKIQKRMRELNYQPNYQARALAGGKTYSIGLIVPDLVHPFFAELAKGLGSIVRESGRVLLLSSSEEDPETERREIRAFQQRGVDALLLASCQAGLSAATLRGPAQPPCVLVDRSFSRRFHFVGSDDYRVGVIAVEHLIATGKKRVAHIGSETASTGRERLRAYRETMAAHKLRVPENFAALRERFEEGADCAGYEAMRLLLGAKKPPDAVFCYNDLTAVGAMAAALAAGLRIPEDIAFVSCGNLRYADYLRVPLSSVDQGAAAMGATAGRLALELIDGPDVKARNVLVEPSLVARASTVHA